jgi:PEGA domain-containing protein
MTLRGSLCRTWIGLTLALLPATAFSQAASHTPLDQSLQGPARDAYAYAKMLFENGDFQGALVKYGQAYEQSKDPRLLYNMALCERNLRAYARMEDLLQRYKRQSGAALESGERARIDAALAAVENLVGKVTLGVDQAGATVAVDGETVGATPLPAPLGLDLGKHSVRVTKAGFETADQSFEVVGGAQVTIAIKLIAREHVAHLTVAADDAAAVVIDGKAAARGRFDGPLAPGPHEVSVTEGGKTPYRAQVDLHDGETRSLEVTLQDEQRTNAVWPWVVGGAVIAAGATVGGYFLFKSSPEPATLGGQFATVRFN